MMTSSYTWPMPRGRNSRNMCGVMECNLESESSLMSTLRSGINVFRYLQDPLIALFGHAACQNDKHVTFLMFNAKELGNLQDLQGLDSNAQLF